MSDNEKKKCKPQQYHPKSSSIPLAVIGEIGTRLAEIAIRRKYYSCSDCKAVFWIEEGKPAPKFCWQCTCEIDWSEIDKPIKFVGVKNEVVKDASEKKLVCPTCKTEYPLARQDGYCQMDLSKLDLLEGGPIFYRAVKPEKRKEEEKLSQEDITEALNFGLKPKETEAKK